ncbi:MAG: hypothetical protein ACREFP_20850 [Acetobacteraceae bacterium]
MGDLVAEITLSRAVLASGILVVEGDRDSKFFRPRLATGPEQILVGGGKQNVLLAVEEACRRGQLGVLGVVDDDCDSMLNAQPSCVHIVGTSERDLDTTLLRSAGLEAVIAEASDPRLLADLEKTEGSVRAALERKALIFGKVRLLARVSGWGIDFQRLNPRRFIRPGWRIDELAVTHAAASLAGVAESELRRELDALDVPETEIYKVLHGHDTLAVLAEGLRFIGAKGFSEEGLAHELRLAYTESTGSVRGVLTAIRKWEAQNQPFKVLR